MRKPETVPTTIHITHPKAGSSWIDAILRKAFGDQVAPRGRTVAAAVNGDLSKYVFPPNRIYSAMFIGRDEFEAHPELAEARRFIVIRDLRDTLVSYYFSMLHSHPPSEGINKQRNILSELSQEDGFLHCMEAHLPETARIQRSWLESGELVYRYEELLHDDVHLLTDILIDRLALPVSRDSLKQIVLKNRFEVKFKRKLGSEDINSHGRQGAPGNWKRYFTPKITSTFVETFGADLIAAGYEKSPAWADEVLGRGRAEGAG